MTEAHVAVVPTWLRRHWFVPLAVIFLAGDAAAAWTTMWPSRAIESAIAIDLALIVPALHLWCYRRDGRRAILRTVALACLGIWVAAQLVPAAHHDVLEQLRYLRYAGLAVLVAIEIRVMVGIYRVMFTRRESVAESAKQIAESAGVPPALAKLMALEARFWRRVIELVRRQR